MAECSVPDCRQRVRARGWCPTHYRRWKLYGDPETRLTTKNPSRCAVPDCGSVSRRRSLCDQHYGRLLRHGDPLVFRPDATRCCAVDGCERPHYGKGWCRLHWERARKTGDPAATLPHFSPLAGRTGQQNPAWVGDEVTYEGLHGRLRRDLGRASERRCAHCGRQAEGWAYNHEDPHERVSPLLLRYSPAGAGFYLPLCGSCHYWFDRAEREALRLG